MEQEQKPKQKIEGKCSDWEAWHDRMPGSPATLHVKGSCEFPTDGYSVELKPASPQGINPDIYLLERVVHKPTGPAPDVITTEEVHYMEDTDKRYTHVQIMSDDELVEVKDVF